jgi:hypothetical protein
MGLVITLESESGEKKQFVTDNHNLLHLLLPLTNNDSFKLLKYIDWYADTVFNQIQLNDLIADIDLLLEKTDNVNERDLLARIKEMCIHCKDEYHQYIKFYGD